jgi:hypothetical protein
MPHANHLALTHNVVVRIFRHVVVLQTVQEPHDKLVMAQIHVEQDLLRWRETNPVCVRESLNQIFLKM